MDKKTEYAFPFKEGTVNDNKGLSTRDYIAIKAVQSLMLACHTQKFVYDRLAEAAQKQGTGIPNIVAKEAYGYAKAMLDAKDLSPD